MVKQKPRIKEICPICNYEVRNSAYWWGEEESQKMAHKKCVLSVATQICVVKDCRTMTTDDACSCPECGMRLKRLSR
jgi:protein-arginine kinase activator protein McsA